MPDTVHVAVNPTGKTVTIDKVTKAMEPAKVEPAPAPAAEPPKPAEPAKDDRFAQLARIEARNRQAERERKAAERQLAMEARAVREERERFARAREDPTQLDKILGPNWYDQATEARLAGGKLPPEVQAQRALEEAKAAREDARRVKAEVQAMLAQREAQAAEQEVKASIDSYRERVAQLLPTKADSYPALVTMQEKGLDVPALVLQMQQEYFERTGKVMPEDEVFGLAEKYYTDVAEGISARRKPAAAKPPEEPAQATGAAPQEARVQRKTLDNGLTSAPISPPKVRPRSAIERALAEMERVAAERAAGKKPAFE
ncbi:MAG TPA: hypothetical protein VMT56_00285 [Candidatus Bathyarchaeia archaeon]|nr:hypothetical protein [Candidatus Bathyarchaeia archaeon]